MTIVAFQVIIFARLLIHCDDFFFKGHVDPKYAAENLMVYIGQAGTWYVRLAYMPAFGSTLKWDQFDQRISVSFPLLLGLLPIWTNVAQSATISWPGQMMVMLEHACF